MLEKLFAKWFWAVLFATGLYAVWKALAWAVRVEQEDLDWCDDCGGPCYLDDFWQYDDGEDDYA